MGCKQKNVLTRWGTWAIILLGIFMMTGATAAETNEKNQAGPEMAPASPISALSEPQFFCGYCHLLTYPAIIDKQHELWKKSKHNEVGCVTCHYGHEKSKPVTKDSNAGHLPKQPPEQFSHLKIGGSIVQTHANIDNATCTTANCHGKPDDDFKTKKIKYTEKVTFVHQPHFEEKNQIKGQKIGCTNCHQHETDLKKFEVSKDTCYLCHFMATKLNDGRGRCELCHKLPEGPIPVKASTAPTQETGDAWGSGKETSGSKAAEADPWASTQKPSESKPAETDPWASTQKSSETKPAEADPWASNQKSSETKPTESKPITHAMLKEADVSCASCHFDLVQSGTGATYAAFFEKGVLKTAVVYGVGQIKKENCQACHDKGKDLKEAMAMELMHQRHVTTKTARCLDCHQPVMHTKAKQEERTPQEDDPVLLTGCVTCHPLPHYYQRVLTSGTKNPAEESVPDPMYSARVNCLGCHNEQTTLPTGHIVLKASEKTCISCHDKEYEKTLKDWKAELNEKIKSISELETQIKDTLSKAKSKLSQDQFNQMMGDLTTAQKNLKLVKFGNGVHNKKYALMLLDESLERFKELKEGLASIQN